MKRFCLLFAIIALATALPLSSASAGSVLNVPVDYPTIQAAIDAATQGDTVLVAPGEYVESIELKSGVTVQSAEGPEVTTIRGDGRLWWSYESHTATVIGADNSVISGFTITGSWAGILNLSSSPTITNNTITGNVLIGIYNWSDSSPTITNNTITQHSVGNYAYGIVNSWYSSPMIINNIITVTTYYHSSGIWNGNYSSPTINNNTITGLNSSDVLGMDGIYNGNHCSPTITNNIITGYMQYGIYIDWWSNPTIIYNNLWGDKNTINIYSTNSNPTVADNISADPLFVAPEAGYYHLQEGSPCIDAGTNDALGLPKTDFGGNIRVVDGNGDGIAVVDMGAFEFQIVTPEFEITSFGPDYIWPPNRKMREVAISGKVILPQGHTLLGAGYSLDDEYGVYSSNGELTVDANGDFALTLQVEAWRDGGDIDGRHYGIVLFAEDETGVGSKALKVLVPHGLKK